MSYLSEMMDLTGLQTGDLARDLGVSDETVRRWRRDDTKPRPRFALQIARRFPVGIGQKLLRGWGYSDKPLEWSVEVDEADPLVELVREVKKIRRMMQAETARRTVLEDDGKESSE